MIERALTIGNIDVDQREAAIAILEHEQMHQETLLYMFHELGYEKKTARAPLDTAHSIPNKPMAPTRDQVPVPAGVATLGSAAGSFGWDNEFPSQQVHVEAFSIDRYNITNGDYLAFMRATGAPAPHFWAQQDGAWCWRGMFGLVALPLDAPVYVMPDAAAAYAHWA